MARFYEFEQVCHLLNSNLLLEIGGHRREVRRIHVLDVLPLYDILLTLFVLQCDRGRRCGPNTPSNVTPEAVSTTYASKPCDSD